MIFREKLNPAGKTCSLSSRKYAFTVIYGTTCNKVVVKESIHSPLIMNDNAR
jgi:hypothetical protein